MLVQKEYLWSGKLQKRPQFRFSCNVRSFLHFMAPGQKTAFRKSSERLKDSNGMGHLSRIHEQNHDSQKGDATFYLVSLYVEKTQ